MSLNLESPFIILVAGKPKSGKSHFVKYLLMTQNSEYNTNPIRYAIVFTKTKFNKTYEEYIPEKYIHPRFDETKLKNLMAIQAEVRTRNQARQVRPRIQWDPN